MPASGSSSSSSAWPSSWRRRPRPWRVRRRARRRGCRGPSGRDERGELSPATSIDPATFLYPDVRDAPPISLEDAGGPPGDPRLHAWRDRPRLLRLHPLPRRLSGDDRHRRSCDARLRTRRPDRVRDDRPGARHDRPGSPSTTRTGRPSFTTLTGTADQIRATADAWGVRYARVDTGVSDCVFDVAHGGRLRRRCRRAAAWSLPVRDDRRGDARPRCRPSTRCRPCRPRRRRRPRRRPRHRAPRPARRASSAPSASPAAPAAASLQVEVVSSAVWAGGPSPLILGLFGPAGRLADTTIQPDRPAGDDRRFRGRLAGRGHTRPPARRHRRVVRGDGRRSRRPAGGTSSCRPRPVTCH